MSRQIRFFFVDLIADATSYNWTLPYGATITSGAYTNSITVNFSSNAQSGIIIVQGNNSCGVGALSANFSVIIENCSSADLGISVTVNNTYPIVGNKVEFTITAYNIGPVNATGVVIADTLQSGYTYISSTTEAYNPLTGIWTINNLNKGASEIITITATVNSAGNYVNTAIIHGNQVDSNSVNNTSSVETYPTVFFIPEGFSPNGDAINDLFVIKGIKNYPNNTILIFNRWGDEVFSANAYQNNWDGKCTKGLKVGGDELPIGTYFYILNLGNGSDIFKGTIYLNR